jgi:acetyl-CoA C-acetyltransferase
VTTRIYILGGYQTDYARNWARDGLELFDLFSNTVDAGLESTSLDPSSIETAHVGNFTAELFCGQGHLGGFFAACRPEFSGIPASRHEGACASGSLAILAAGAEIEAGRYDLSAVIGVEIMRNVSGAEAAKNIGGTAMWNGHECINVQYPWPHMFSELGDEYDRRYGLKHEHLARIAEINFANAKRNPNSQTREWQFTEDSFLENDEANPIIEGRIRKQDCGQITDGAAIVFLASAKRAKEYAVQQGISLDSIPYIKGWGHSTAPIAYQDKIDASRGEDFVFPHLRQSIEDSFARAGIRDVDALDGIETHDCFTTTEYMAIDHFGITAPGESWKAIESGDIEMDGRIPINPSGGLIGLGHPVGATGVRMALDCYKQTTGQAGDYQVENASNFATLNVGGSATTSVSFVFGTA